MAYTPTNWNTGDTVTATKLNKLEQGVANAGSALIVEWDLTTNSLNKTVAEIYSAYSNGTPVFVRYVYGTTEDYTGNQRLAPITYLYNYNYANTIRIVVSTAIYIGSISNKNSLLAPSLAIFSASSTAEYPQFYATVSATQNKIG